MVPVLRLPKSPTKASFVRHDEHCKGKVHRPALDPDCPICQAPIGIKTPEGVVEGYAVTPCGHVFGSICIKTYLAITEKPQCPICRLNLYHHCSHPVHPVLYDHKKARLSPTDTAAKAFAAEFSALDCEYCHNRRLATVKQRHKRLFLDATKSAVGASSASLSASSAASGTTAEGSEAGAAGAKATRKLNKTKRSHGDLDNNQSGSGDSSASEQVEDDDDDDDEGDDDDDDEEDERDEDDGDEGDGDDDYDDDDVSDHPLSGSSASSPQGASRRDLPPVPGPYGHWDLANKDRDWNFLTWYNKQDPKINPSREHYS